MCSLYKSLCSCIDVIGEKIFTRNSQNQHVKHKHETIIILTEIISYRKWKRTLVIFFHTLMEILLMSLILAELCEICLRLFSICFYSCFL